MSAPGGTDPVAPVGGGMFEVNIAEAPRAIRELETARQELRAIKQDALRLGHVDPSATDEVSVDAARALGRVAVDGPASFVEAVNAGINELTAMIESLERGFATYSGTDERGLLQLRQSR